MASTKKVKKEFLFLHSNASTKKWLRSVAKRQDGHVSLSQMANRIFRAARKNPKLIKAA